MANRIKKKKKNNFTSIPNEMLADKRLSRKARGLLAYMLSKPDNRSFNNTDLERRSEKDGRTVVENAKKELKDLKYLIIKETRDKQGKIGYDWHIFDEPYTGNPHTEKPSTDYPGADEPGTENLPYSNTDSSNTDIESTKVDSNPTDGSGDDEIISGSDNQSDGEDPPPPGSANPPPQEFGKHDINELIETIKEAVAEKKIAYIKTKEREFANHILHAKEFVSFAQGIGKTPTQFAIDILEASIRIGYYKGPCAGPMMIYQNYGDVYNRTQIFKLQSKDPIKAWVEEIKDEKLKSKIIIEIENRKAKNLPITTETLERIKTRLLSS